MEKYMNNYGIVKTECCGELKRIKKEHNGYGWQWHYVCCGWGHTAGDGEMLTKVEIEAANNKGLI